MMKWHRVRVRPGFNGFGDIDPYIDWAFGAREVIFRFHNSKKRYPLLVQLRKDLGPKSFADGSFFRQTAAPKCWSRNVRVSPIQLEENAFTNALSYFTALVTEDFFVYFDDPTV